MLLLEIKEDFEKLVESYDISDMLSMKPLDLEALMLAKQSEIDLETYNFNAEHYKRVSERLARERDGSVLGTRVSNWLI